MNSLNREIERGEEHCSPCSAGVVMGEFPTIAKQEAYGSEGGESNKCYYLVCSVSKPVGQ